ncbi:hypothetical protein [Methyloglobulus sp.]|uniref:hypothetical protein n=1 Tax=Methyloglobulus sp. TaxID=2518622 RepID=UPI0017CE9D1D|nr:hypothetical protein [Methyloglobulus sp.]
MHINDEVCSVEPEASNQALNNRNRIPTEKMVKQQMQRAVKAANSTGFTLLKELNHQSISLFG